MKKEFNVSELNEIAEVKDARNSVWKKCKPVLEKKLFKTTDDSIAFDMLENWKVDIYNSKLKAKNIKKQESDGPLIFIPESGRLRGVPNVLLRSAIFGIDAVNNDEFIDGHDIACQNPFKIIYTGFKLTQFDLDIWLSLIYLAGGKRFEEEFDFSISDLLEANNKTRTGPNAKSAIESLIRLSEAYIVIYELSKAKEVTAVLYEGYLIDSLRIDDTKGRHKRYYVSFGEKMRNLYQYDSYVLLNWDTRQKLTGKLLAQWLHAFYSSHAQVYDLSINYLYALCGSKSKHKWKFKQTLLTSLNALSIAFNCFEFDIKNRKKIDTVEKHIPVAKQTINIKKESSEAQKNHLFMKEMSNKVQAA